MVGEDENKREVGLDRRGRGCRRKLFSHQTGKRGGGQGQTRQHWALLKPRKWAISKEVSADKAMEE